MERFTIGIHENSNQYIISYTKFALFTFSNLRAGGTHAKSNDVLRVRAYQINSATPLVTMSSLYMHQLVKSMGNWNMYNDNIMTSDVA